ncbi:ABC transporter permease, partial [Burkholderia multivorans]
TFVRRIKEGQLGSFPVILALVIIVIVFQSANSNFISPANLVNLSTQVAYLAILALGINLILLLGEIDLSLAQLGGLCASVLGVLVVRQGVPPLIALTIMLLLGLVVGAIQGWFFAVVGIPAFVVTLAGLLAFTGLTLTTLGTQKNLSMADTFAFDFA